MGAARDRPDRGFGSPPPNGECTEALFVQPFGPAQVAIVRVKWPRFHFLVFSRDLYYHLHDPFAMARRYPVDWQARDAAGLGLARRTLPKRTVAMLDEILKHGDGPFLLGAAQTLVDGGKIVLERGPEEAPLHDLWALLPEWVRRSTWPATYAFGNDLGFDVLVMPAVPEGGLPGYLGEDQARDYPDSRYESQLQLAIECGDQPGLDRLLTRKSTSEMIRVALIVVIVCFTVGGLIKALMAMGVL